MLKICRHEDKFIAKLSIDQKKTVIDAGFLWDDILCRWEGSARAAYRLIDFADRETEAAIMDKLNLRFSVVPPIQYPTNRNRKPFEHQLEGARWVLSRKNSYIAYEAGLGKTMIAPLCLNTNDGKALIVCPSFLKLNWEDELEQGLIDFHHIQILRTKKDEPNSNADIYIVPDSLLHDHNFRERFFKLSRFKYLFIDEAHRFKSADARRTMSLAGRREVKLGRGKTKQIVSWKGFHHIADHTINLSGTPMPNGRPLELYPLISKHAPQAVNYYDPHRYGVRYCGGFESEWGWDYTGATNLEELHRVLNRNYMIVKRKRDCLDMPEKLPPKFIFIDDERGEYARDEMQLLQKMRITEILALEMKRSEQFKQRVQDALEDNPDMGGFGFISELRKMLGLSKVKASVSVIKELMEEQEKLVVFCWHKEVAAELCAGLEEFSPLKVIGGMKEEARYKIVKTFQANNKNRILVANIQAAGVGLTFTKAKRVVFVEPSWVPADNDQAFDRIDRIGQDDTVQALFLVVKNSLDHLILNAHIEKSENTKTAIKPI